MKGFQKLKLPRQARFKFGMNNIVLIIVVCIAIGFFLGYFLKPDNEAKAVKPSSEGETVIEPTFEKAMVVRVIDGDTVELKDGRTVRYLGIDTPESNEYFFQEATVKNKELVEGKEAEFQQGARDVDEYGRLLRYVYVDGTFVNAELVAQGYAKSYIFDPDDKYSQVLVQLEQYAKMGRKGMWESK